MKKLLKFLIYIFYVTFSAFLAKEILQERFDKSGFFSVTKIEQGIPGDSSILEFISIFNALLNQGLTYNLSLSNLAQIKSQELNIMITRDIISFVVLDIVRLFRNYSYDLVYYATDVFSNRVDSQNRSLKQFFYTRSIDILERFVWSRADFIFANRLDECEQIAELNSLVLLVPAKSRSSLPLKLRFPDPESGLKFVFVGASGNLPNRQSIETFLSEFWPTLASRYPGSSLKIVGKHWDKYISPPSSVALTGFLTDEDL